MTEKLFTILHFFINKYEMYPIFTLSLLIDKKFEYISENPRLRIFEFLRQPRFHTLPSPFSTISHKKCVLITSKLPLEIHVDASQQYSKGLIYPFGPR